MFMNLTENLWIFTENSGEVIYIIKSKNITQINEQNFLL